MTVSSDHSRLAVALPAEAKTRLRFSGGLRFQPESRVVAANDWFEYRSDGDYAAHWRIDGIDVNAVALTPNAAVVAHGVWKEGERLMYFDRYVDIASWRLTAFGRADGKQMWTVELPGEPIFNGIAPTADGGWVVVLRDGGIAAVGP